MAEVSPQEALVYIMVVMSAADATMTDGEMGRIGEMVKTLPVFDGFSGDQLIAASKDCQRIVAGPDGFRTIIDVVARAIPARLRDTAYCIAVDIAAVDLEVGAEEARFLQLLRENLMLEPLTVAAIERAAAARYRTAT